MHALLSWWLGSIRPGVCLFQVVSYSHFAPSVFSQESFGSFSTYLSMICIRRHRHKIHEYQTSPKLSSVDFPNTAILMVGFCDPKGHPLYSLVSVPPRKCCRTPYLKFDTCRLNGGRRISYFYWNNIYILTSSNYQLSQKKYSYKIRYSHVHDIQNKIPYFPVHKTHFFPQNFPSNSTINLKHLKFSTLTSSKFSFSFLHTASV
jgi:hypothetical protein